MERAIVRAVSAWPASGHAPHAFQIFGLDIKFDAQWKPYLLEINYNNGLHCATKACGNHQRGVVADIFKGLFGFPPAKQPINWLVVCSCHWSSCWLDDIFRARKLKGLIVWFCLPHPSHTHTHTHHLCLRRPIKLAVGNWHTLVSTTPLLKRRETGSLGCGACSRRHVRNKWWKRNCECNEWIKTEREEQTLLWVNVCFLFPRALFILEILSATSMPSITSPNTVKPRAQPESPYRSRLVLSARLIKNSDLNVVGCIWAWGKNRFVWHLKDTTWRRVETK